MVIACPATACWRFSRQRGKQVDSPCVGTRLPVRVRDVCKRYQPAPFRTASMAPSATLRSKPPGRLFQFRLCRLRSRGEPLLLHNPAVMSLHHHTFWGNPRGAFGGRYAAPRGCVEQGKVCGQESHQRASAGPAGAQTSSMPWVQWILFNRSPRPATVNGQSCHVERPADVAQDCRTTF